MAERAVVNASPLIFLSRAGLMDLLQLISSEVVVPEAVAFEIEVRGNSDPTAQALATTSWLLVTPTPPIPAQIQAWGLGPGESSVIAWAHSQKAPKQSSTTWLADVAHQHSTYRCVALWA